MSKPSPALGFFAHFVIIMRIMIITYYGKQFFKIQLGDTVLAFNPISKDSKLKAARFGADVVLTSLHHPDFNGVESVTYGEKAPFVISGPGEYEIKGIFVKGFFSESSYQKEHKVNTIYLVSLDGMNLCFLGALQSGELDDKTKEALDDIDILFVPVGGEEVLAPDEAHKLATKLAPHVVIPMDYGEGSEKNALQQFLKEGGVDKVAPVEKLTIKKKDLEDKEGEVIVLKSE